MPYESEKTSRLGYGDILSSPSVAEFLAQCEPIRDGTGGNPAASVSKFIKCRAEGESPAVVVGTDGSFSDRSAKETSPPTRVAFVKIGMVGVKTRKFSELSAHRGPMVPEEVDSCFDFKSFSFALPSSNVGYRGSHTVREGFRKAFNEALKMPSLRMFGKGPDLVDTLRVLASEDGRGAFSDTIEPIRVSKCPNRRQQGGGRCGHEPEGGIQIRAGESSACCPRCGGPVFASDWLGIHEHVNEDGSGGGPGLAMMAFEHLLPVHHALSYVRLKPSMFGKVGFVVDGPLALFNFPARVAKSFGVFYEGMHSESERRGMEGQLVFGAIKTGRAVDHIKSLRSHIPDGTYASMDRDEIGLSAAGSDAVRDGSSYGRTFAYASRLDRFHVFDLPASFGQVPERKIDTVISAVDALHDSKFQNGLVPISKVHQKVSISAKGGVLLAMEAERSIAAALEAKKNRDVLPEASEAFF